MTLLEKLDRLPPLICRLLAKRQGVLMSDPQLMEVTGWGKTKLSRIYNSTSWTEVAIGDADVFLRACGMSWSSQRRARWLLRLVNGDITKMRHLRNGALWQVSMIKRHQRRVEKILKGTLNGS